MSLDPAVAERARRDVEAGRAKSVSAWLNDAARLTFSLIEVARRAGRAIVVPAGVVGQVWHGGTGRQTTVARLLDSAEVNVEPLTDTGARAAGVLCGTAGTAEVVDASVVLAARMHRATVVSSDRGDLAALDRSLPIVDC